MKPQQQRIVYYALGLVALVLLWYFLGYRPLHRQTVAATEASAASERQLAEYTRIVNELPSILAADRAFQAQRRSLNSSLYAKEDVLALFRQLTADAAAYDLKLVQISPPISELLELNRRAGQDNDPLFLNVTLDFEGRYDRFGQFVSALETKPYFRTIRSCFIRSRPASTAVDLSLSFRALLGTSEATAS